MAEQPFKIVAPGYRTTSEPQNPLSAAFQQLQQAEDLRVQGQLDRARLICDSLVQQHPDYFGALYTLGLIFIDMKHFPQALGCLVRAAMLNPDSWRALTALSAVYLELGATEMAALTLERATQVKPDDPNILLTLGEVYREEREYELARHAYEKAYQFDDSLQAAAVGLGACYAHLGMYAEAAEIFEFLVKQGIRAPGILAELLELPNDLVTIDVEAELEKITSAEAGDGDSINSVAFVRAAILDRVGKHREAWEQLMQANQALQPTFRREAEELAATQRANLAQLREKKIQIKGDTEPANHPLSLFILGPSRSGKTTVERLVGSLKGVRRGYENPSMENAIRRTFQSAGLLTSKLLEVLPPELDSKCCTIYLRELNRRVGSARVFTNTNPIAIHDAARVAGAIPNVRFIFVKRNVDDTMLRIFMRKYEHANAYAYDLRSIREHVLWYHEMIDLLLQKLPTITRVINYEEMVREPGNVVRTAAELCRLPSDESYALPRVGNDQGCAEAYRDLMMLALKGYG